jgi:hypothetical protein
VADWQTTVFYRHTRGTGEAQILPKFDGADRRAPVVQTLVKGTAMQNLDCPLCNKTLEVIPRDNTWTGGRPEIRCPHCSRKFRWKFFPFGVRVASRPIVPLLAVGGTGIDLEDYETTIEEAQSFTDRFREVWARLPGKCTRILEECWSGPGGAPHVWLLFDPSEWCGKGWAASSGNGRSFFFAANVVARMPSTHLRLFIAHELGHALFITNKEASHIQSPHDAESKCRCEWLVWQLMSAWGYDQIEAEVWMERHFEKGNNAWVLRATPLDEVTCRNQQEAGHRKIESNVGDKSLPAQFAEWRQK